MNRIYKIIWNAARNAYVVVSELASKKDTVRQFSSKASQKMLQKAAVLAATGILALSGLGGTEMTVYAATIRGTATNYYQYAAIKAGTGDFNNSTVIYITEDNQILKNENGTVYTENLQDLATGSHVYANETTYSRGSTPYDSATGAYNLTYTVNDTDKEMTAYKYILSDTGYYFRENYTGTVQTGKFTDAEDVADKHLEIVYTGVGDPPTTVTYGTASDNDRVTNVNTNLHEELQKNESGTYTAATNSVGIKTNDYGATVIDGSKNANFIIKDNSTSWNTVAGKTISSGGYVNVATKSDSGTLPDGFVVVTNINANGDAVTTTGVSTPTSGLYWDAGNNRFLYNGKTVSSDNVYVINGQVGVFTTGNIKTNTNTTLYGNTAYVGDTVYTGTVYGKGNGVLQTKSNLSSDRATYRYNSYWSVQETDDTMTMGDYSIADYHNDLTALYNNDQKLLRNDINHAKVADTTATDSKNKSATLSLYRNGENNKGEETTANLVDGQIVLKESGGTGGISTSTKNNDRTLTIGTQTVTTNADGTTSAEITGTQTFTLGSVVGQESDLAKGENDDYLKDDQDHKLLQTLTINGETYGFYSANNGQSAGTRLDFQGDNEEIVTPLNNQLQIYGGITDEDALTEKDNIGVIGSKEKGNLKVRLAKKLDGLESATFITNEGNTTVIDGGGITINNGGDTTKNITIRQGDVNMGGNQIHNVAPGTAPTDAVNVSQLGASISNVNHNINKLGSRINRVGAGAAALAALHPLDFDPDAKWDFAAGYGNFRGANAAAIGAYYRPNEDTMFNIGGSFGGGENMVNAGVTFKVGTGANHVSTSRVAMAKEIRDLRNMVVQLTDTVNKQQAMLGQPLVDGSIGSDLFPDVPENHWAYEYVEKLHHSGILQGYPDGEFKGDRMMTRYEFAAIVYRAIMNGAAKHPDLSQGDDLNKLTKEFSNELKYIRIDTIAKDKNGKPTIERVRVIKQDKDKEG